MTSIVMAVTLASSPSAAAASVGGGIVHQGTLLNIVKNIFPDHGLLIFIEIYFSICYLFYILTLDFKYRDL